MPDPTQPMPPGSAVPLPQTLTPESIRDYLDGRMREHREWERQQYGYQNGYSQNPGNPYPHTPGNPHDSHMPEPWQFDLIYRLLMRIVQHLEREEGGGNPYPRHYSREERNRGYDQQGRPIQLHVRSK